MQTENRIVKSSVVTDADDRRLRGLLRYLMSHKQVKHALLAVESEDRRLLWRGAAGVADPVGTPMQADTPFNIASIDKLYTATVVMQLHERGRIALDAPISTYLDKALIRGVHRHGGVDYTDAITVRHLLSHTSGLADWLEDRPRGGRSFMERLFEEGDRAWTLEDLLGIVRDDLSPHFPPQATGDRRAKARYSDTNYQLLIAIIESVTGQPAHAAFQALLFRPLDLRRTCFLGYSQPLDPTPAPATIWAEDQPLDLPLALPCFPSIYATAEDCLAFLRAFVHGRFFDEPATLALMQGGWRRFGFAMDHAALRSPGWPIEYGLGIMRFRLPRLFTPLRPLPAVTGHTGSTGCWLFHCPERGLLFCGTVDQATAGAVPCRLAPRLLRMLEPTHD